MKIKNSKLELQKVENLSELSKVMSGKNLRYKTIYAILPTHAPFLSIPCVSVSFADGIYKLNPKYESVFKSYREYYVITKDGTKESKISYTEEERERLVSIFSGLVSECRFDTAEILCHTIGNKELLTTFYSDYGKMEETKKLCIKLLEEAKIPVTKNISSQFPIQYQRPKYSIYDLAQDLIKDKASICTDNSLIGSSYKKISRGLEKTSEFVEGAWNPIVGQSFNKTRANLNLNYLGLVKVEVPENEVGVEPGQKELKTLKSICLVKDGKVCNTSFGIRINSKVLERKLRSVGIIKESLVYSGDYLIDIETLPVISKSKTSNIRSFDLALAEINYRLSDIALEYLRRRQYKESKGLETIPEKIETEKTPQEAYLESLGIYGDYFYPDKKVGKVSKVYDTTELVASIKTIPAKDTCTKNITKLLNGSGKINVFVSDFINTVVIPDIDKGISYSELIKKWENKKNKSKYLIRDLKFRLITGKSMKVCVHGCHKKNILDTKEVIKVAEFMKYEIPVSWSLKDSHVIV